MPIIQRAADGAIELLRPAVEGRRTGNREHSPPPVVLAPGQHAAWPDIKAAR